MPNRLLKESICTSEEIDKLSSFQEAFFYRLIVNCDDHGRMDARPRILASKLFPLKDIRMNQIEDALRALTSVNLVILYEVDGKPFLQMKTWDRHQQIRAHKSKYPPMEEGNQMEASDISCNQMISDDINCKQMISDDIKCSRNPIQSKKESNPNPNTNPTRAREGFEKFWAEYPKHENKEAARKAFEEINPDETLLNTMIGTIRKQKDSPQWQEDGGRFIPYPANWLTGKRWEDEVRPRSAGKAVQAQDYEQREYGGTTDDARKRMLAMLDGEIDV